MREKYPCYPVFSYFIQMLYLSLMIQPHGFLRIPLKLNLWVLLG